MNIRSDKYIGWIYSQIVFGFLTFLLSILIFIFHILLFYIVNQRNKFEKTKKNYISKSNYIIALSNVVCWAPLSVLCK